MYLKDIDNYYYSKPEPMQSCLLALRSIILNFHPSITESWKFKTPCFDFKYKMCAYLWIDKKTKWPYIGIVKGCHIEHPQLTSGGRKQIKTLLIDPNEDIPIDVLTSILDALVNYYLE